VGVRVRVRVRVGVGVRVSTESRLPRAMSHGVGLGRTVAADTTGQRHSDGIDVDACTIPWVLGADGGGGETRFRASGVAFATDCSGEPSSGLIVTTTTITTITSTGILITITITTITITTITIITIIASTTTAIMIRKQYRMCILRSSVLTRLRTLGRGATEQ
jgi:hypothetical protein